MNKINFYVFIQLFKSCTLIFFIFISIAWLLQTSRLFTIINMVQVKYLDIIILSSFLIPSLINVTLPFILIFGMVLCFIKLDKDKEIIAIYSLGLGSNSIKLPLIFFCIIFTFIYLIINFYFSPLVYEKYKHNEFEIRNTIDFEKFILSNFIELNKKTVLDFEKKQNNFENIFIKTKEDNESLIYSKKGEIISDKDNHIFNLIEGFKIDILENEIEKLEFNSYFLKIPKNNKNEYNVIDKNTQTFFDDLRNNNSKNIVIKFSDIIIFILISLYFYYNNILRHNYHLSNNIKFIITSIFILILNQLIKNTEMQSNNLIIFILINISIFLSLIFFMSKKR